MNECNATSISVILPEPMNRVEAIWCNVINNDWRIALLHPRLCDDKQVDVMISDDVMDERRFMNC